MEEDQLNQMTLLQGKTFMWHEIYAKDSQPSIDFYTKALGFGSQEVPMGEMGTYKMLTREGQGVCGVVSTSEMNMPDIPPHWATYISVPNVDSTLEAVKANGGNLVHGPMDVPNVGRMALISDPQGAHVWIFTPAM